MFIPGGYFDVGNRQQLRHAGTSREIGFSVRASTLRTKRRTDCGAVCSGTDRRRLVALWLVAVCMVSCTSKPTLPVSVVFENGWKLGKETLTEREMSLVRSTALQTLRSAYSGFGVQFSDQSSDRRLIKLEDTPYGSFAYPGAGGMTYPIASVRSVRLDALYFAELSVVRCQGVTGCDTKTRDSSCWKAWAGASARPLRTSWGIREDCTFLVIPCATTAMTVTARTPTSISLVQNIGPPARWQ